MSRSVATSTRPESKHRAMLRLEIPRKLESPNKYVGRNWRVKHRITKQWESDMHGALLEGRHFGWHLNKGPRTVHVERRVPKRQFIRDDDNLRFSVKPLCDALKRLGLIYDDRREYLTLEIVQVEAPTASTVITVQ